MIDYEKILLNGNYEYQNKIINRTEQSIRDYKIPKYPVLILTCMDPRIDIYRIFQLKPGDVFVLRNGGNIFTEDVLRSILIAIHEYGVNEIIILGHLDCGMTKISLKDLQTKLDRETLRYISRNHTNIYLGLQRFFRNFADELKNIENQITSIKDSVIFSSDINVEGMLYDPASGWVFDLEHIKKYGVKALLYENYEALIEEKEEEYRRIFQKSEKNNDSTEEVLPEIEVTKPNQIRDQIEDKEKKLPLDVNTDLISDISLVNKIKVPKVPKVYIPKVKVNIPHIYKKKSEKNSTI
jgi:carbonic anhydrase